MKQINHKIQPYLWAIIVAVIAFVLFWLTGCNPIKRSERQDEKAVLRVNANANLQGIVASKWLDAHPPIEAKPEIKYLPGNVIYEPIQDTAYKTKVRDSLTIAFREKIDVEAAMKSFDLGYDEAERYYRSNPFIKIDTVEKIIPDLREANRQKDSADKYRQLNATKDGQIIELRESLNKATKRGDKWFWYFVAAIGLGVLSHIVRSLIPKIKLPL